MAVSLSLKESKQEKKRGQGWGMMWGIGAQHEEGPPWTHSPRALWHLRTSLRKVVSGVNRAGAAETHSRKPHNKKALERTDSWGSLSQFS